MPYLSHQRRSIDLFSRCHSSSSVHQQHTNHAHRRRFLSGSQLVTPNLQQQQQSQDQLLRRSKRRLTEDSKFFLSEYVSFSLPSQ